MSCIESASSLPFTLLTAPTQETYTLWNSKDKNRNTLMNEDRITELYRENVYTKLSPDQPFASISVSEDGFVAFAKSHALSEQQIRGSDTGGGGEIATEASILCCFAITLSQRRVKKRKRRTRSGKASAFWNGVLAAPNRVNPLFY